VKPSKTYTKLESAVTEAQAAIREAQGAYTVARDAYLLHRRGLIAADPQVKLPYLVLEGLDRDTTERREHVVRTNAAILQPAEHLDNL
jgi:hypothetical protein